MKKVMFLFVALMLASVGAHAQTVISDTVRSEVAVQPQPTDDHIVLSPIGFGTTGLYSAR